MSPAAARKVINGRRAEIEAELTDRYHVDYTFRSNVSTEEFDIDKSLDNQARFQPIDEETVELYKEGVERGDKFPAVLAHRPGRGANPKLVIIDGNHRLVAHNRADKPLDVYEIDRATRGPAIATMTFAFNTRHGRPTSDEERVHQALYLIDNGSSQSAAAAVVNVRLALVQRAVQRSNADKRAREVGADLREWEALSAESRRRLLTISTDEGFSGSVHLAQVAHLGTEDIVQLVALLNTSKSAAKQRALIKAESERLQERIQDSSALGVTTRKGTTPRGRVSMVIGQILALPDDFSALARSYSTSEREDTAGRLIDASERLRKLAKTLDSSVK